MKHEAVQFLMMLAVYALGGALRYVRKTRFWQRVEASARETIADPATPVNDPREAAERALLDAQRAQLDRIERSIREGGNGMRPNGRRSDDDTPKG